MIRFPPTVKLAFIGLFALYISLVCLAGDPATSFEMWVVRCIVVFMLGLELMDAKPSGWTIFVECMYLLALVIQIARGVVVVLPGDLMMIFGMLAVTEIAFAGIYAAFRRRDMVG